MNSALQLRLLKDFGIKELTSFQQRVFNVISKEENDLLIHAGTGKGKTLSYLLPLANQMYEGDVGLTVALIQPNSLLKAQVRGVVERLAPDFMNNFKICTPRQLRDQEVNACVIDEADLTLSAACLPPKMKINDFLRGEIGAKKRIIYSGATFPVENSFRSIRAQILKYNKNTVMIEDESIVSERVAIHAGNEKFIRFDKEEERLERLRKIITSSEELKGKVMIFVRNKTEVAGLKKAIKDLLTKNEVIVTTDSMSRGIDIDSLQHVVHYYPPMSAVDYVHRVGRVNRLNSKLDRHECKSHCLISNEDLEDGPVYLKLLLNSRDSIETVKSADITKFFSRNRSINKQIRRAGQELKMEGNRRSGAKEDLGALKKSQPPSPIARDQKVGQKTKEKRHIRHKSWTPIPDHLKPPEEIEETPLYVLIVTYFDYFLLVLLGHIRDFFGKRLRQKAYAHLREQNGYAPLVSDFESFYTRRLYTRIRDCWNRPITGVPGRTVTVLERSSSNHHETFELTGRKIEALNLGSYNYLGFAQSEGPCTEAVIECIKRGESMSIGSTRSETGNLMIHEKLEELVADFVGKEAAMVFSMGFATNSTMISAFVEPGCLIISDELNHASLITGSRLSGASIKVFKHNDHENLEKVLRDAISQGQPRTHRPWKKIMVIVEGLYSMEGTICRLPQIIELKKKYKFYLFVDEAHSVGALGPRGRGVCDFWSIDPEDVDILMGTFTKSFGASGGYIASSRAVINQFKSGGHGFIYSEPMPPVICQQVYTSMRIIKGDEGGFEGINRLQAIYENSIYFMRELKKLGFIVYGDEGSPVIPLLIFHPAKIAAFSREALARGLAVVVVGYPATPIITSRVRFCISAAHTRADLDLVLEKVSEIGDILGMKVSARKYTPPTIEDEPKED